MAQEKISSLLVTANAAGAPLRAGDTGIVTERDVLRALEQARRKRSPGRSNFASKPLVALPAAAFVYRALGRMSRLKLRHLGVENDNGEICGIVTARDLLRLRAQEAVDPRRRARSGRRRAGLGRGLGAAAAGGRRPDGRRRERARHRRR